jgi:arginyl-tRNA synthetase
MNLFDYFEELPGRGGGAPWAARSPRRPQAEYDLRLFPRRADWQQDGDSLLALEHIRREPWVADLARDGDGVRLRLADGWVAAAGAALEAGGHSETPLSDLAAGGRYSVQFWDPNATKALHVGHLRNLAIGNAVAAALAQAGAQVERRSRISDTGRAMGEAMAGVIESTGGSEGSKGLDQKSDHFVGACYADYVARSGGAFQAQAAEQAEDSLSREVQVQDDSADVLIKRVLGAEPDAIALWYRTRAWVIAGQRKTLSRLGIAFDRVLFESDFLPETAELVKRGLSDGTLVQRGDGVVVYRTGHEELEELPLLRADGLSTQHLRSLTYAMTAPDLEGVTSLQVTGSEWVSHVTCIKKLAGELDPELNGGFHPSRSIFHGMVSQQRRALTSSAGALLVDDLLEGLDEQMAADPELRLLRHRHPHPERIATQIALGYFLPHPVSPDIDFDADRLLSDPDSLGLNLVRARAHHSGAQHSGHPVHDPRYRFAVLQSELYRRHLRTAVERIDVRPLAHYLKHLAAWQLEDEHDEAVDRVVHTLLDRGARGLGLDPAQ